METPASGALLTSKLRPQRIGARCAERPRLRGLFERAPDARLILVSAPPGFGKTTALVDWLETAAARYAWLTLDHADNDVVRFARYLAAALGQLTGGTCEPSPFDPGQPFDPELALEASLSAIEAAGTDPGIVLVLDDYHVVFEPAIHRLIGSLIERLRGGSRLAIVTRADPPLPIARLRARGELIEVRAEDLRFTQDEAAAMLGLAGIELELPEVDELTRRTEGWAAALRLAAVSLRDRTNHAEFVRRFGASHRYVLDYVVEEVLTGLPEETQRFLLRTSILERLCGSLCDAVTGELDGQARLEELERSNLLIIPLDDERRWYRYHALFGEILRSRLAGLGPGEVAALHAKASAWHQEQGDDGEAIAHALSAGDPERAGALVARAARRHINAGEIRTVRRWLDALPDDVVKEHPQLAAGYAWCLLLAGETDGVAKRLAEAERALGGSQDAPETLLEIPAQLAMLRSQLAGAQGDAGTAVAQARLASELVPPGLAPVAEANLRGSASSLLGLALVRARALDAAAEAYEAALPDLRVAHNELAVGRTVADLAAIEIKRGNPARALALCEAELGAGQSGAEADGPGARSRAIWSALARAHAELGQLDAAEAAARRAVDLATRAGEAGVARSAEETLRHLAEAGASSGRHAPTWIRGLVEPLTARELEVLRQVALGRSNTQIATELFVTVGTVKAHVHSICGKLGAANRVQAIVRARELRILD